MAMPFVVRSSPVHGRGAFARRGIAAGSRIGEYTGERITRDESTRRFEAQRQDDDHPATYKYVLDDLWVIDGMSGGNDTRFINHGCQPNCVAVLQDARLFIDACRDIPKGGELLLDYKMGAAAPIPDDLRDLYACFCGAPTCRGTMLRVGDTPGLLPTAP